MTRTSYYNHRSLLRMATATTPLSRVESEAMTLERGQQQQQQQADQQGWSSGLLGEGKKRSLLCFALLARETAGTIYWLVYCNYVRFFVRASDRKHYHCVTPQVGRKREYPSRWCVCLFAHMPVLRAAVVVPAR